VEAERRRRRQLRRWEQCRGHDGQVRRRWVVEEDGEGQVKEEEDETPGQCHIERVGVARS